MFTTVLAIYSLGALISKGAGSSIVDSLKWPITLYKNIKNNKDDKPKLYK